MGFAPEFVMIKCSTRTGTDWMIYDSVRDTASLSPNTSSSEASGLVIEFTPNGFQPKVLNDTVNSGEDSYIYAAFAGGSTKLTFEEPNEDLKYFQPGDQVGTESGFTPVIYTGNGTSQSLNCGFSPDLVWIKSRTATYNHLLFDSIRGAGNSLSSNATGETVFDLDTLSSFDSDGFSIGSNAATNSSNIDLVAWCWDAGDSTVTNNDGSIESQVRAGNGFSIVTYTGNLSSNGTASVGHGLGKRPSMIITKSSDTTSRWPVMHTGLGDDDLLVLSEPDAKESYPFGDMGLGDNSKFDTNYTSGMNTDGANFVAYCWAETPGVSSFGEYAGTSTANSIECGFKPGFVLIKASDADRDWFMFDSARSSVNPADDYLLANSSDAEVANNSNFAINFTDTGFTINGTDPGVNSTGYAYIYAAFAGSNPIEVIDVDVAANTMTVDGGVWEGSDGSGSSGTWNQSQVWSANGNQLWAIIASAMFDGVLEDLDKRTVCHCRQW